jgi:copper homeostasis protein (lipoprotein)
MSAPFLTRVADHGTDEGTPLPVHGLRLPASFIGTLPCADCAGIAHHLDLFSDQGFHLRREWLEREEDLVRTDRGRWHLDPATGAIVLGDVTSDPIRWQVTGPESLRLLAQDGSPILSDLPYDLTADGTVDPVPVAGAMTGAFVYFADAALFEDCRTGLRVPVAMEGDYLALERAYLDARGEPAAPVLVTVRGDIASRPAMEGSDRPTLRVDRLLGLWPNETCDRNRAQASFVNTYWRLERMGARPVAGVPDAVEPHMVLLAAGEGAGIRVAATAGCNRMMGGVETGPESVGFGQMAMTMMACPPPLDALERDFAAALEQSRGWQIAGQTLILTDEHDEVTALFRAVYLP